MTTPIKNLLAAASLALLLPLAAFGQPSQPAELTDAEVRKVDPGNNKLTLKHGPIKSLDMPAMTMVFRVMDPAVLAQVKAGDRVRFSAEKVEGAYTVTNLETAK